MESDDLDHVIEQTHLALREIVNGNPQPWEALFSHRDDVTLGNPFGPFARGWKAVAETAAGAATRYRDGEIVEFEPIARHVTSDLACLVEVERFRAKVGGSGDFSEIGLRVTSIFRPEHAGSSCIVTRIRSPRRGRRNPSSRSRPASNYLAES